MSLPASDSIQCHREFVVGGPFHTSGLHTFYPSDFFPESKVLLHTTLLQAG